MPASGWRRISRRALKGKDNAMSAVEGPHENSPEEDAWQKAMGEKGWGVPTWPAEYGGGGLNRAEARVLQEEMARVGAWNPIGGMGVMMFGPTLLEYGSEAQKKRAYPGDRQGDGALVPGLFGAGRGIGPRQPADLRRGQGRPLCRQRPEDLDQRRAMGGQMLHAGPHGQVEEA
jgi:alkylation response protein AidB-like acyl-CoA dehydrogenase